MRVLRSALAATLLFSLVLTTGAVERSAQPATDPLPSWNDGATKKAILAYVAAVTKKGGPDFIPPEERIATFDNDGTLWCEKPTVEIEFTKDRIKEMVEKDPALKLKQPYKAALENDHDYFAKEGEKAIVELIQATHGDMSHEQFVDEVRTFLKSAKNPKFNRPYTETIYQPMLELMNYLRANGFQVWICSGGDIDFMRVFAQEIYGVPPQQVIGSTVKKEFVFKDGKQVIWRLALVSRVNDRVGKPIGIELQIGKRPVFSAGNVRSGGDIAMLEYCQANKRRNIQLMVNHDDSEREFAYTEPQGESLAAARDKGWNVVSMKSDWKNIFPFDAVGKKSLATTLVSTCQ